MYRASTCAGIIASLIVGTAAATAHSQSRIGDATKVVRDVTGIYGENLRKLQLDDDVYHDEVIESGAESASLLTFLDETTLAVGPESRVTLDDVVYNPDASASQFAVSLVSGVLRFSTGNLPNRAYSFKTPTMTIGVRGTDCTIATLPSEDEGGVCAEVVCTSGAVTANSCDGQDYALEASSGLAIRACRQPTGTCDTEVGEPSDLTKQKSAITTALLELPFGLPFETGAPPIQTGLGPLEFRSVTSIAGTSEAEDREEIASPISLQ